MLLIWIIAFAITITIHEAAHAYMADKLGDPTARAEGRLTLNPIAHYDPVGTTLLLALVVMRAIGIPVIPFGWAKPVPIDPYNLKSRGDLAKISLAGPGANFLLALALSFVVKLTGTEFVFNLLFPVILLNVSLAIFNLVPVYPLDGGKVLSAVLSKKDARTFDFFMERYGVFVLFFLIFPIFGGESLINTIIIPIIGAIVHILVPGAAMI